MSTPAINYYPVSPSDLPKNLTKLPSSYMIKASLAILAILVFFVLYACLVLFLGYLFYLAVTYPMPSINRLSLLAKLGAVLGSSMLFAFTLKFIFKLKNHIPENRIQLQKADHPTLWNFVAKVCAETGAPKPKHIYVDPDVNAYVRYTNSWLSLFLPVKKELTIGLGLVSCVNLSEFKAIIAHEFGHFAQSSMKIGSYIMTANTIIFDMIHNRDKWDDLLDKWRSSDLRLSAAAWVITPIIWIIRQILAIFYKFLNIMYSSLSREMEFNADKVAVSTTGSEAIVSALWKLDPGSENWSKTMGHAHNASQKKMFAKNLYSHNLNALKLSEPAQIDKINQLPENVLGGRRFFNDSNNSKAHMYASHPANDLREKNAKSPYIECKIDESSPWVLFDNDEVLQEEMTLMIYQKYFNSDPSGDVLDFESFDEFIVGEQLGEAIFEEYHNSFDDRFLIIPDDFGSQESSIDADASMSLETLKSQLGAKMNSLNELKKQFEQVSQVAEGIENSMSYKGTTYNKKNIDELYGILNEEYSNFLAQGFLQWDKNFCKHLINQSKLNNCESKILDLLQQHKRITNIYQQINEKRNSLYSELEHLQNKPDLMETELNMFGIHMTSTVLEFNQLLDTLDELKFIPLPNIDSIQELKEAIVKDGKFIKEKGPIFQNGNIQKVIECLNTTIGNLHRIDRKSISNLLMEADNMDDHS